MRMEISGRLISLVTFLHLRPRLFLVRLCPHFCICTAGNSIHDVHLISGFSILTKLLLHRVQFWCSRNPVLYHVNVASGSPLLANFHTPPPSLVAITVDGWMAGDGRACMCWRLRRLLLLLCLRVHGIPITGEGKGWSKLGRSLTLTDHARFLVYMYVPSFLWTAF